MDQYTCEICGRFSIDPRRYKIHDHPIFAGYEMHVCSVCWSIWVSGGEKSNEYGMDDWKEEPR